MEDRPIFRLSKIETRLQEIVLIQTFILSSMLFLGGAFYLHLGPEKLLHLTGVEGSMALGFIFQHFGLGLFIMVGSIISYGTYFIRMASNFEEIRKNFFSLIWGQILIFYNVCMSASLFSILQKYKQINTSKVLLPYGLGGKVGAFIGGSLFESVGLFGALGLLLAVALAVAIFTQKIEVVNLILGIKERVAHYSVATFQFIKKFIQGNISKIPFREEAPEDLLTVFYKNVPADAFEQTEEEVAVKAPPKKRAPARKKAEVTLEAPELEILEMVPPKVPAVKAEKAPKAVVVEAAPEVDVPAEVSIAKVAKKYPKPSTSLLANLKKVKGDSDKELQAKGQDIQVRLAGLGIPGKIVGIFPGDRLTMFEFMPDPGTKVSKIQGSTNDLAMILGAPSIRILAPIPGKNTIGIEIPNTVSSPIGFAELVADVNKKTSEMNLPVAIGKNVFGKTITSDLTGMPHLLVSGTTGSGKSVFVNNLIASLLFTKSPSELRLLMIDPKMIELTPYNGIPHLLQPVITDVEKAKDLLVWAEKEMDRRYQIFADLGARGIESFNEKIEKSSKVATERRLGKKLGFEWEALPFIVIFIDELADLMITQGKLVEIPITRIAQKARACGIHMVIATQRPSAEVVTGLIKTNFPTRVAFKVSSAIDSRTILDAPGAEKLLGHGDMLYMPNGKTVERLQGCFISEQEVNKIVNSILNR